MNEHYLINGCLQRDPLAQRELYNRFSPKMLGICYRFAQNKEDAEDMLQEGFVKVFNKIEGFQNKGSFEGWIRKIMVHTCINFLKRNKRFQLTQDISEANEVPAREESIASILQSKQVLECIRLLPLGYRTVLNLYAIEGYSHKEVGDLLEIGESTSRSQFTRAKNMLAALLIKHKIVEEPSANVKWAFAK